MNAQKHEERSNTPKQQRLAGTGEGRGARHGRHCHLLQLKILGFTPPTGLAQLVRLNCGQGQGTHGQSGGPCCPLLPPPPSQQLQQLGQQRRKL